VYGTLQDLQKRSHDGFIFVKSEALPGFLDKASRSAQQSLA